MAPAAQYRETSRTITTTAKDTEQPTTDAKDTQDGYNSASTFNWPSATPSLKAGLRFPIPQIQGIIPGMRCTSQADFAPRSFPNSPRPSYDVARLESSKGSTTTPTTPIADTKPSPHRSSYPRVSPPGILYPDAIVPYSATQYSNPPQDPNAITHNELPYHPSIMGRVDYELAYLAPGYKILFVGTIAILALGAMWTVITCAISMRTGSKAGSAERKGKKNVGNKREERRPIDKVSKYAHRHGSQSGIPIDRELDSPMESDSAVTSAAQIPFSYLGDNGQVVESIEMTYRPKHTTSSYNRPRSRAIRSEFQDRTYTTHRRFSSSPSAGPQFGLTITPTLSVPSSPIPSTSGSTSPINPFLDPPPNGLLSPDVSATLVKRSLLEWQAERAAFFGPTTPTSVPASGSVSPALSYTAENSNETFELNLSDMEAMEAGTAHSGSSTPGNRGSRLIRKSKSFIDEGIGMMEGVVDGVAAKIARWTDDDGGDDALLLPVARGK